VPSPREQIRERLTREVKRVFDDERSRPGALRIAKRLTNEGFSTHRKMVTNIRKPKVGELKRLKNIKLRLIAVIHCLLPQPVKSAL
jgi:hypothetical protein